MHRPLLLVHHSEYFLATQCYNCGEAGHLSRDCTAPRAERGSGGGSYGGNRSCYNCGCRFLRSEGRQCTPLIPDIVIRVF